MSDSKKVLYINACARGASRTDKLARTVLSDIGCDYVERKLYDMELSPLTEERLLKRTELIEKRLFSDDMFELSREFADADIIVIAAPFWDLSFPAILKLYIENIYITGIVSEYTENGMPHGLCKAEKLYYVTTAGGPYNQDFSYGYIKSLAMDFFGIKDTELVMQEMLDV
jgi:FMN-dependent NADH-azoreductase